jgi:LysR family transcriptional regulator, nitrogen assimilation regulatory protein
MELRQLTALIAIAETGSITRAADRLRVVQPAVTRQLQALERELGVELFERTRRGMRATPAGQVMLDRARRALTELERGRAEIRPDSEAVHGIVTVGLLESTSEAAAEPLVSAVSRDYPGIELRVITGYSGHLQQWLDAGDLDLSLLYNLERTPSLSTRALASERLYFVAPASDALDTAQPTPLHQLEGRPVILPTVGHGLRTLIDAALATADIELNVVAQTNSMRVQKKLVSAGHGWTILPGVGITTDVATGALSASPISEPEIVRSMILARRHLARTLLPVEAVADTLTRVLFDAAAAGAWLSARWEAGPDRWSSRTETEPVPL